MKREPKEDPRQELESGVSRRSFLKGVGATAAASGLLVHTAHAEEEEGEAAKVLGPQPVEVKLEIDGKARTLSVEPRRTLLDALRDDLGVTAPKRVCDRGACGSCTVLVDGVPHNACMNLAVEMDGRTITTASGLGQPDKLNPVQEMFWKHDAHQCGFCTPGFVTSMSALFAANPQPSEEEIQTAGTGNLCRCGTYTRILDAARELAKKGG